MKHRIKRVSGLRVQRAAGHKPPGQERKKRQRRAREDREWASKNGPVIIVKVGVWPHEPDLSPDYLAHFESEEWALTRRTYFAQIPRTCLGCPSHNVELHHLTYKRFRHEWWSDLIPLCRPCHDRVHQGKLTLLPPASLPNIPILA